MVRGIKPTSKGCGSWDRVIGMKGTNIGCGSFGGGIKGWGNRVWPGGRKVPPMGVQLKVEFLGHFKVKV